MQHFKLLFALFCWQTAVAQNLESHWYGKQRNPDDFARNLTPTSDGGYILTGKTCPGDESHAFDAFLLKTDSLGKQIWMKTYGLDSDEIDEEGLVVEPTTDGGYILAGRRTREIGTKSSGFVYRVDANGNTIWSFEKITNDWESIFLVREASDGGVWFAGQNGVVDWKNGSNYYQIIPKLFIGKLSASGELTSNSGELSYYFPFDLQEVDGVCIANVSRKFSSHVSDARFQYFGIKYSETTHKHEEVMFTSVDFAGPSPTRFSKIYKHPTSEQWIFTGTTWDGECWFYNQKKDTLLAAGIIPQLLEYNFLTQNAQHEPILIAKTKTGIWLRYQFVNDVFAIKDTLQVAWDGTFKGVERINWRDDRTAALIFNRVSTTPPIQFDFSLEHFTVVGQTQDSVWTANFGQSFESTHEYLLGNGQFKNGNHLVFWSDSLPSFNGVQLSKWAGKPLPNLYFFVTDDFGKKITPDDALPLQFDGEKTSLIDIEPTPDGQVIVLFCTETGRVLLSKFDEKGGQVWEKQLPLNYDWKLLDQLVVEANGEMQLIAGDDIKTPKTFYSLDAAGEIRDSVVLGKIGERYVLGAERQFAGGFRYVERGLTADSGSSPLKFVSANSKGEPISKQKMSQVRIKPLRNELKKERTRGGWFWAGDDYGELFLTRFSDFDKAIWEKTFSKKHNTNFKNWQIEELPNGVFLVSMPLYDKLHSYKKYPQILPKIVPFPSQVYFSVDAEGRVLSSDSIFIYPKLHSTNPNFFPSRSLHFWTDAHHGATRDLLFVKLEFPQNPPIEPDEDFSEFSELPFIFPNPSSEALSLRLAEKYFGKIEVSIYASDGRRVRQFNDYKNEPTWSKTFQEDLLPDGFYIVRVQAGEVAKFGKWLKIKKVR